MILTIILAVLCCSAIALIPLLISLSSVIITHVFEIALAALVICIIIKLFRKK